MDRPPQDAFGHVGSHSGHGERAGPDKPIIMTASRISRSSASGSDHTIENLRTPLSMHPSERVIPPLPRHYSGTVSKSPTDIYGGQSHGVAHEVRPYHNPEIYSDGYGRGHERSGPIYYIIPGGMDVIFQDEHGNEITRVGDFSGRPRPSRPGPFVVQNEFGKELYRYDDHDKGPHRGYSEPPIVQIDHYSHSSRPNRERSYSSHTYRSDPSHRRLYDHRPDFRDREYRGEKDYRDHRDHSHRDYRGYDDHKDYGDYSDRKRYRDHSDHRGYGSYRDNGDHRGHGRSDPYVPGRVSSRTSHRSHSHASQVSVPTRQYSPSVSDDRRLGANRDYAGSHHSSRHQEDGPDISDSLRALHI
ncbi:hypothetical protein PAXRUDRAFT_646679 [Paxillus rubicundulus Ve08.2h10]|uniref:Uncharacterized protein n=1 Tax=Paxillus rubicundulus Ve08.2h10 TaxID=930991 RepID=A0A0D0E8S2_9AGAM|nr:hypothetical protein PAXRUDRAFT_646679 [Paxillus rubicundulus Ve08.2h10]